MSWRVFRRGLLQVHLWLALILCLPMVVIGISGSALLLQREILSLMVPGASEGPRRTVPEIVAAAAQAAPQGLEASRIELPGSPGDSASVRFRPLNTEGPELDLYVDPVSLAILGQSEVVERGPILAFLITIHAFLALPPPIGLPFVGWNGVVMTFMGFSGLALWWPRKGQWRHGFFVRRGAKGWMLHHDLHRAVGIWGLLVFLAVSVSGIYLTFPQTIGPALRAVLPGSDVTTAPQPGYVPGTGPIGPEEAIVLAHAAIPNARVSGLELPSAEPDADYVLDLEPQGMSPSQPGVLVVMSAQSAEITYIDDPRNYGFREKLLNWQHLLHFGVGLGWFWTILVFLSGLLPLLFAVTGITMWWKKSKTPG
jgi:uncharacterized iron-regulated membrane protein